MNPLGKRNNRRSLVSKETPAGAPEAQRWDYIQHPVRISGNLPLAENVNPSDPMLLLTPGQSVGCAFDGYGAQGNKPAACRVWNSATLPTPQAPVICEVDYGTPVAVTAFVHYFYVPGSRNLNHLFCGPSAFRRVRIGARNTANSDWKVVATLEDLSPACPQVLPVATPDPARYWRLEILELGPGAEMLLTYEIETYTGGVPKIAANLAESPDPSAAFAARMRTHRPSVGMVHGAVASSKDDLSLEVSLESSNRTAHGQLQLAVKDQAIPLKPISNASWEASLSTGSILIQGQPTPMGLLLELTYTAKPDQPIKYQHATLQMRAQKASPYYMPAYVWSEQPVTLMVNAASVQTRLATLSAEGMTLCLVPGTDHGKLGFRQEAAQSELLLGPEPVPVLLTAVSGDWWEAYRFAIREIYAFREQPQTVPVSEIQYGISRYMVLGDDVWEPTLGTVRSWPVVDAFYLLTKGFTAFAFYGATYSVPCYWARYVMSEDDLARERCRSIIHWLCRSGVRMQQGPTRGAFFSEQRFYNGEKPNFEKVGSTQANTAILTSQSTGAALWTLLYYRAVSGERNQELDEAIDEAAAWLLKTQLPDGGWPYGHDLTGKPLLDQVEMGGDLKSKASPSSGAIWNIRALWRLGQETAVKKYLEAAENGKSWFASAFIANHHHHGYWEDGGPGTREGYAAAVAALTFVEMGDRQLAIDTAKDAVQWVFTRQIECREPNNSAGLVAEQTGWPPASYCNPIMALAAWTAWQASGDDFWQPFAMIPKAIGWWYQPDRGAMVWIPDGGNAPIVGPHPESWWNDWTIAQVGALALVWLIKEVNRRAQGAIEINEDSLMGTVLGRKARAWAPQGGIRPILPTHGQVNWVGFRSDSSFMVALFNHGVSGEVGIHLNSRNVNGVRGATVRPEAIYRFHNGIVADQNWNGTDLVKISSDEMVLLVWNYTR